MEPLKCVPNSERIQSRGTEGVINKFALLVSSNYIPIPIKASEIRFSLSCSSL